MIYLYLKEIRKNAFDHSRLEMLKKGIGKSYRETLHKSINCYSHKYFMSSFLKRINNYTESEFEKNKYWDSEIILLHLKDPKVTKDSNKKQEEIIKNYWHINEKIKSGLVDIFGEGNFTYKESEGKTKEKINENFQDLPEEIKEKLYRIYN